MNRSHLLAALGAAVLALAGCATPAHEGHAEGGDRKMHGEHMKSMSEPCRKQMEQMHAQRHGAADSTAAAASAPGAHACPMMKKG